MMIGTMREVMRNDFFLTFVVYSREITVLIILKFIYLPSPVTSLIKMSFILGMSSLNERTVTPVPSIAARASFVVVFHQRI